MYFISLTDEVLKFDKSIEIKDLHPENMEFIFVTDVVFKFDKSIYIK